MQTKKCKCCNQIKSVSEFHKHLSTRDKLRQSCKNCRKSKKVIEKEILFQKNKKYCPLCNKIKDLKYFSKGKKLKYGYKSYCKKCVRDFYEKNKEFINKQRKEKRKHIPWKFLLSSIKQRCNNSKVERFKNYGGRGIKCNITENELKELWFRDKAYNMKKPSIDRIDNDGNYEYANCRFIEMGENSTERNKRISSKRVLQYDLFGNFIKEWSSLVEASLATNQSSVNISACCNGKTKQAKNFIWKLKEKEHL